MRTNGHAVRTEAWRRLGLAAVLGAWAAAAHAAPTYKAEIRRTAYGVPHISARTFRGLGYGAGYAYAQDNVCLLAEHFVTVRGERSRYFGPDGMTNVALADVRNLDSDFFFKLHMDDEALREAAAKGFSRDYADLVRGYVAGFNRYLRDTPADRRPEPCRNAAWVTPATYEDMLRLTEEKMVYVGSASWISQIVSAAPPSPATLATAANAERRRGLPEEAEAHGVGSNAWAFGRDVTANGSGVLLANPHFPWGTIDRMYMQHLTVPHRLDVMGVTLPGFVGIAIGFNQDMAWTHTFHTGRHFTVYALTLDPSDPTAYLVDGKSVPMVRKTVTVEVAGRPPETRTFYSTRYGPVVTAAQTNLVWTATTAYAMRESNHLNMRAGSTWLEIARARSVGKVRAAVDGQLGLPWTNTFAVDRWGDVLYADVNAMPDVTADLLKACLPKSGVGEVTPASRIFILDGSRSACDWIVDPASPVPGLAPAASMPHLQRRDFVANSNDSFWLVNPAAPLTGFSPLQGRVDYAQNLRTRSGLLEIDARLKGLDGLTGTRIDPAQAESMLFRNRVLAADLFLDDALAACTATPSTTAKDGKPLDLAPACAVLRAWDRRMDADSRGAHLFLEFWTRAAKLPNIYAAPFDLADPVHTPRGLRRDPDTDRQILAALGQAVEAILARGASLDARWGDLQFVVRGGDHIPIHGGDGSLGVLNAEYSTWVDRLGYIPHDGSSYIQAVTWEAGKPVVDAMLSYSQSTDPASPHESDQTRDLYARKRWLRLPFDKSAIQADQAGPTLRLSE